MLGGVFLGLVGVREVGAIERCEGVGVRGRFEERKKAEEQKRRGSRIEVVGDLR